MPRTMPMIEARNKLTSLPEEFEKDPKTGAVMVTRRGKPVLAVLSWELYEAIVETLEVMGDEDAMAALREDIRDAQSGRTYDWEEVKREIGL